MSDAVLIRAISFGFLLYYRFLPSLTSEPMPAGFSLSLAAERSDRPEERFISKNGPYIGGHLAFYFKLNFIMYYKSV